MMMPSRVSFCVSGILLCVYPEEGKTSLFYIGDGKLCTCTVQGYTVHCMPLPMYAVYDILMSPFANMHTSHVLLHTNLIGI